MNPKNAWALLLQNKDDERWFPLNVDYPTEKRAKQGEEWQRIGQGELDTHKVCPVSDLVAMLDDDKIDFGCYTKEAQADLIEYIRRAA